MVLAGRVKTILVTTMIISCGCGRPVLQMGKYDVYYEQPP
jgi:hypothetical protein